MCGITGVYNLGQNKVDEKVIVNMRDVLRHRGPDAGDLYLSGDKKVGLGFRRLSIIDLSEAGDQPMSNEDKTVWIVFNGEIYNFQVLREDLIKKGHTFKSKTDTEVIIHLYEEKGEKCLEDLNGMFAFVIWDEKKKRIFAARDRLGIKPFYYFLDEEKFVFGSEIKAILQYPGIKAQPNKEGIFHYLTFACTPAPFTLFKGIQKLAPANYLILDEKGRMEIEKYWTPVNKNQTGGESEEYYIKETISILKDSIEKQMISDVPFGCFLSGGIDSSTNAVLMSRAMKKPVETFSISFKDLPQFDEFPYSRQIADLLGSKKHETLIGEEDFIKWLPIMAHHADDPNGDPVCFPVYHVSKLIRDSGVIMAQVGEGADELFCGYGTYMEFIRIWKKYWKFFSKLPKFLRSIPYYLLTRFTKVNKYALYKEFFRRLTDGKPLFFGGANAFHAYDKQYLLTEKFKKEIEFDASDKIILDLYEEIRQEKPDADFLQKMVYLELSIRLPELLLMRVDKMASATSIEARVPFLDHRLAEMAFSIPMDMKIKNNVTKYILKKAVRGIIPDEIIDRKKKGFGAPVSEWLKKDSKISEELINAIKNSKIKEMGIFDYSYIDKLIYDHQNNLDENSFKLWNLITLSLWYDKWVAGV